MDPETLHQAYMENRHRPAWIRRHRAELQEATGLDIPRNLAEITSGKISALTKKMNEYIDDEQPDDGGGEQP